MFLHIFYSVLTIIGLILVCLGFKENSLVTGMAGAPLLFFGTLPWILNLIEEHKK